MLGKNKAISIKNQNKFVNTGWHFQPTEIISGPHSSIQQCSYSFRLALHVPSANLRSKLILVFNWDFEESGDKAVPRTASCGVEQGKIFRFAYSSGSWTFLCISIISAALPQDQSFWISRSGVGLRICISDKVPGADTAGLGDTLWHWPSAINLDCLGLDIQNPNYLITWPTVL